MTVSHLSRPPSRHHSTIATALATLCIGLTVGGANAGFASPSPLVAALTCETAEPTLSGTGGPDDLVGTSGDDAIFGSGGDDVIHGLEGSDLLCGGRGADVLYGEQGDDRLFGQADRIEATGESDNVHWGDRLVGGVGSDLLDVGRTSEPEYAEPEVFDFSDLPAKVAVVLSAGSATSAGDVDRLAGFAVSCTTDSWSERRSVTGSTELEMTTSSSVAAERTPSWGVTVEIT